MSRVTESMVQSSGERTSEDTSPHFPSSPLPSLPLSLLEPSITSSLASPQLPEGGQLAALVPSSLRQSLKAWGPLGPCHQPPRLYPLGFFLL